LRRYIKDHAAAILPVAFVGRFDDATAVKKRWEEVWEAGSYTRSPVSST
jgi:hypothetical protein